MITQGLGIPTSLVTRGMGSFDYLSGLIRLNGHITSTYYSFLVSLVKYNLIVTYPYMLNIWHALYAGQSTLTTNGALLTMADTSGTITTPDQGDTVSTTNYGGTIVCKQ